MYLLRNGGVYAFKTDLKHGKQASKQASNLNQAIENLS